MWSDTGKEMWMHRRLVESKGSLGFLYWTVDMGNAGCVLIICDELIMSGMGMVRGSRTEALVPHSRVGRVRVVHCSGILLTRHDVQHQQRGRAVSGL